MKAELVSFGSPQWGEAVELRRQVLRRPLGLDFTEEELAAEHVQLTAVISKGSVIACAMMTPQEDGNYKVRQVAVDPGWQGKGLGRLVMLFCEEIASQRGAHHVVLHARETAVPFYLAIGYEVVGDPFEEVGLPHRKMAKAV